MDFFAREVICFSPSCEQRSINFIIQSLYESKENVEMRAEAWKRQAAKNIEFVLNTSRAVKSSSSDVHSDHMTRTEEHSCDVKISKQKILHERWETSLTESLRLL